MNKAVINEFCRLYLFSVRACASTRRLCDTVVIFSTSPVLFSISSCTSRMSQFYARYVPPAPAQPKPESVLVQKTATPDKRKRVETEPLRARQNKKTKLSPRTENSDLENVHVHASRQEFITKHNHNGNDVLQKYKITSPMKNESTTERGMQAEAKGLESSAVEEPKKQSKNKTKGKRRGSLPSEDESDPPTPTERHAAVMSKYQRSRGKEHEQLDTDQVTSIESVELHGLEPIPQPEESTFVPNKPTYSTLPKWQESHLSVVESQDTTFKALGIPQQIMKNLHKNSMEKAFPIQATVLPLLLEGPTTYDGDLCVSAATGSGKTLAYVLPMIADLSQAVSTRLRGVIVVPTRELVKQVRDSCEVCALGTSLKIATAVGSKSLKDEQDMLIRKDKVYDMAEYKRQQQSPIDWSTFSLEKLVRTAREEDPLESYGFVTRYRSKVDILITTPGRLVDHLRSTEGFNLDDVKWMIVDEADRLLNESYQEWIQVVTPALQSQAATRDRDELLKKIRMAPPKRRVRKILLSATMTRDITKLNALGLYNPKLVVLGAVSGAAQARVEGTKSSEDGALHSSRADNVDDVVSGPASTDVEGVYNLPESLRETVVPVPDGSDKPLYLLRLLTQILSLDPEARPATNSHKEATSTESTSSDSSFTSSDESDADEATSSDTESDSDATSSSGSSTETNTSSPTSSIPHDTPQKNQSSQPPRTPRALIFTRSTASANRLSRLLTLISPSLASQISTLTRSTTTSSHSRRSLSTFTQSKTHILIATDRASRGLDVPGLENVVSYDVPNSALSYVHRVGRTARAGKTGNAFTLLEHREAKWFWAAIGGKGQVADAGGHSDGAAAAIRSTGKINRITELDGVKDKELRARYEEALRKLGEEARA